MDDARAGVTYNFLAIASFLVIGPAITAVSIAMTTQLIATGELQPATEQLLIDLSTLTAIVAPVVMCIVTLFWAVFQIAVLRQHRELEALRIEVARQRQVMQSVQWLDDTHHLNQPATSRKYVSLNEPLQRKHYDGY